MSGERDAALLEADRERESLLDFLYVIPAGLARLDRRGRIELANPELARLMQSVSPGGGMNNFFDFLEPFAPELRARAQNYREALGKVFEDVCVNITGAASPVAALFCSLVKQHDGGFVLIARDATEATQKERERRRALDLLELSQRITHVGHYRIDVVKHTVIMSGELFRICGRPPREGALKLDEIRTWLHPDDRAGVQAFSPAGVIEWRGRWEEARFVRPDGEPRDALGWWEPERDAAGALSAISGVFVDVTERKALEREQIRLKRAAEQASRAKSDFLAMMNHELRTPMNGVIGMNALLIETELSPEQRRMAATVQQSADALMQTLDDILEVARIDGGRIELRDGEFDLRRLIDSVVDSMRDAARTKGLALVVAAPDFRGATFHGDAGRLRQILTHFVSNAVKFTDRGGVTVEISMKPEPGPRAKLRFEILDTGIGVKDAEKARIFKPFIQADPSISRREGGCGLGLGVARGLIALMDGVCGVADRPGGGSIFWFEITLSQTRAWSGGGNFGSERTKF